MYPADSPLAPLPGAEALFRINVKGIFEGIAANLLVDFDQIQAQIDHDGERGAQREKSLSDFLAKYLPKKYALGSGQVIDKEGNLSKQCDVVIYDAFNCPLLLVKEGYQLFPAESVFGVIEVKSIFSANSLTESVQNIQSVKRLRRREPIAGCVFAYRSEYKTEPRIVVAVRAQDIVDSFERAFYLDGGSGHREQSQTVQERANSGLRRATVSGMSYA